VPFLTNGFVASAHVQLETQLNNIRLMHSLLSEHLELDSFEDMLNEVNESTSLVSFHGRVILHVRTTY
jgi:cytoplasmic FMR1 interacting protein